MDLRINMADPAGNRTAIVRTQVPAQLRADTAARIMRIPELRAEQVGFETAPVMGGAGRLEMMGGEFCGNAARSYGFLLCQERGREEDRFFSDEVKTETVVFIEMSGYRDLLKVSCDPAAGTSIAQMPMPEKIEYTPEGFPLVISEGITHMVLEDMEPDAEMVRRMIERYGSKYEAFGMQFLKEDRLVPVVYVGAAGSLVYESSCGSGSLAAAWYMEMNNDERRSSSVYRFKEPGGELLIRLYREEGGGLSGEMGGKIVLEPEISVSL